jgi:hypothetical protein
VGVSNITLARPPRGGTKPRALSSQNTETDPVHTRNRFPIVCGWRESASWRSPNLQLSVSTALALLSLRISQKHLTRTPAVSLEHREINPLKELRGDGKRKKSLSESE